LTATGDGCFRAVAQLATVPQAIKSRPKRRKSLFTQDKDDRGAETLVECAGLGRK